MHRFESTVSAVDRAIRETPDGELRELTQALMYLSAKQIDCLRDLQTTARAKNRPSTSDLDLIDLTIETWPSQALATRLTSIVLIVGLNQASDWLDCVFGYRTARDIFLRISAILEYRHETPPVDCAERTACTH